MDPKIVTLPFPGAKPPQTCIVTGRRDGPVVDFGKEWDGIPDPHIYIRLELVEKAAKEAGMVRKKRVEELEAELEEANAEAGRLRAIVAGKQGLSEAEDRLREALGPASTTS